MSVPRKTLIAAAAAVAVLGSAAAALAVYGGTPATTAAKLGHHRLQQALRA